MMKYTEAVEADLGCNIDWKWSPAHDGAAFPALDIKVSPEIVTSALPVDMRTARGGIHLAPHEFHDAVQSADGRTILIDVRNNYEYRYVLIQALQITAMAESNLNPLLFCCYLAVLVTLRAA